MALSKETIKNLLDVMQKLSLAIAVVSAALLSKLALSQNSVEQGAKSELANLMGIYFKNGALSPKQVIDMALRREGLDPSPSLSYRVEFEGEELPLIFLFSSVAVQPLNPDWANKAIAQTESLEDLRKVWNTISLTTKFWHLDRLIRSSLVAPQQAVVDCNVSSFLPEPSALSLLEPVEPSQIHIINDSEIELDYDLALTLKHLQDNALSHVPEIRKSKLILMHYFRITEATFDNLKTLQCRALWHAVFDDSFSPAVILDRQLGEKHDFAETFPAVDKLPDPYQKQRLSSLSTSLDEAVQQSNEQIEVFGAKISSGLILLFGLPILLAFLFQFSALAFYGASRVEQIDEEDAAQWSFMFEGWPFLILRFGAICVLPAAASVLSLWQFLSVPNETILPKPIYVILTILVVLCSLIAFISLEMLRSRGAGRSQRREKASDFLAD